MKFYLHNLFILICLLVQNPCFAKTAGSIGISAKKINIATNDDSSSASSGLFGQLKYDLKFENSNKLKSEIEFQTDQLTKDKSQEFLLNPKNVYYGLKLQNLDLKIGFQTLALEGPDFLNPMDIVHSKNWIDPTQAKVQASLGFHISQELDGLQWSFFFIPEQTRPLLPSDHSHWWPRSKRLPLTSDNEEIQIPSGTQYAIQNPIEMNVATHGNIFFNLLSKNENFEIQGGFYEGLSQDPYLLTDISSTLISLSPRLIVRADSPVRLIPFYYRHRVLASTFLIPFDSWTLKGGFNWKKPLGDDERIPSETSVLVLSAEKNIELSKGILTIILEKEFQKKQNKSQISFLKSIFEDSWTLGIRWPLSEETTLLGGLIYDQIGRSSIFKLNAQHRLNNHWNTDLSLQTLQGPAETLLGLYDPFDSVSAAISYHF